jgi:hypothetical protein
MSEGARRCVLGSSDAGALERSDAGAGALEERTLEIGFGAGASFAAVEDGSSVTLVRGFQGAMMITPTLRLPATARDGASRCLRVRLTQTIDGIEDVAPGIDTQLRFERVGANLEVSDLFDPVIDDPARAAGRTLTLRAEVRGADLHAAKAVALRMR